MRLRVLAVLSLISLLGVRAAAAECKQPSGKPIYSEHRRPLHVEPGIPASSPTERLSVYAGGAWTLVGSGDPDSGDTIPRSGCIGPAAMRELTRAVARASFRHPRGRVMTCQAIPTTRITYAAPRRRKQLTVDVPCGVPPDVTTGALIACVEAAHEPSPPSIAELRTICRDL